MPRSFTARRLVLPLKCLISAALLYWLFSRIDAGAVIAAFAHIKLSYLPAALALLLLAQFLSSVRWGLLARSVGFTNSFVDFTAFYWIGMFFNLFLPGIVGGDVGKTFYLVQSRPVPSSVLEWTGKAAASVISDRAVGLVALVWMAAIAIIVVPVAKLPESVRTTTFFLAITIPFAVFLLPYMNGLLRRWGYTVGESVADALDIYRRDSKLAMSVVLLAVAIHLLTSAIYLPIGWSLGVDLPRFYAFATYAVVTLVSTLPITVYGVGIRESALVFMLAPVDVPGQTALAFGVLLFLILLTTSLSGGVIFLMQRREGRHPA